MVNNEWHQFNLEALKILHRETNKFKTKIIMESKYIYNDNCAINFKNDSKHIGKYYVEIFNKIK